MTQRIVEANDDFKSRNDQFIMGDISFDQLTVNNHDLNYYIIKPASFNDSIKTINDNDKVKNYLNSLGSQGLNKFVSEKMILVQILMNL